MIIAVITAEEVNNNNNFKTACNFKSQQEHSNRTTELSNDEAKLGYYSPSDGMRLHVIDTDPTSLSANGWLEDLSKVEKYVMSDEAYEKREGTYRQSGEKEERGRSDVDVTKRTTEAEKPKKERE